MLRYSEKSLSCCWKCFLLSQFKYRVGPYMCVKAPAVSHESETMKICHYKYLTCVCTSVLLQMRGRLNCELNLHKNTWWDETESSLNKLFSMQVCNWLYSKYTANKPITNKHQCPRDKSYWSRLSSRSISIQILVIFRSSWLFTRFHIFINMDQHKNEYKHIRCKEPLWLWWSADFSFLLPPWGWCL